MSEDKPTPPARELLELDRLCCQFEAEIAEGQSPSIGLYLNSAPVSIHQRLFEELLALEIDHRRQRGLSVVRAVYEKRWPNFRAAVEKCFQTNGDQAPSVVNCNQQATMPCRFCQGLNEIDAVTCKQCQRTLIANPPDSSADTKKCSQCARIFPISANFCGDCGILLPAVKPNVPLAPVPPLAVNRSAALVEGPGVKPTNAAGQMVSVPLPNAARPDDPPAIVPRANNQRSKNKGIILSTPLVVSLGDVVQDERREIRADVVSPLQSIRPMVLVPSGSFKMGSPEGCGEPNERPQHLVSLSAYYIDQTAVTNLEYEQFDPSHCKYRDYPSDGDDDPVVFVNHEDCLRYCHWRSEREGCEPGTYLLPTEAQWERAARGGYPDRIYPWGNTIHADYCNSDETGRCRTLPVKSGLPNGFQLYFMGSNVREWCLDYYGVVYYDQSPSEDPPGPPVDLLSFFCVVRGASFSVKAELLGRCAARGFANPTVMKSDIGFRCVRLAKR